VQRRGHVGAFRSGQSVAGERQSVTVNVSATETGAGREHQHRFVAGAAHMTRLGHAAVMTVVADRQRNGASSFFRQRAAVSRVHIPAFKTRGQIGRAVQHSVTAERPGNRQPDSRNLIPVQLILRQKFADGFDPAVNDGIGSILGIGRTLEQFG